MNEVQINAALEKFKALLIEQDERNQKIKATKEFKDFKNLDLVKVANLMRTKNIIDLRHILDPVQVNQLEFNFKGLQKYNPFYLSINSYCKS